MDISSNIFDQAASIFFPKQQTFNFYELVGGVNNWTKGIITSTGHFVIRIYNNGKNLHKVKLQHELLLILQKVQKSFKTPEPITIPGTCQTIAVLKDGYPCCAIKKIQGSLPKSFTKEGMQNFGRAVSEISKILSKISISEQPIIKPYYDLYSVYYAVKSKQDFVKEVSSHQYDSVRNSANKLLQYLELIQSKINGFHANNFPTQLIHGDLHTDNILMKDNKITAILDFQFVAKDWRAMQLAISLSKYVNLQNFEEIAIDFNRGYSQIEPLSQMELLAVPWLIILRLVSNFIYFTGRVMAKEQSVQFCKQKIQVYRQRIDKLLPKIQQFQKILLYQKIVEKDVQLMD